MGLLSNICKFRTKFLIVQILQEEKNKKKQPRKLRSIKLSFNIMQIGKKAFAGNQDTLEMIDIPEGCKVDDTAFEL